MSRTENSTESTINETVATVERHDVAGTQLVKPIELAKALGIPPQTVYQYIRKGVLESMTEPATGKILVKLESASTWVDKREAKAADKAAKEQAQLEGETVDA